MTPAQFKAEITRRVELSGATAVARALGVSRRTVYNWLEGMTPQLLPFLTLPEIPAYRRTLTKKPTTKMG